MPGAARARATTGIWRRASSRATNPAAATGSHGTWWPGRAWYQPCPAITALAVNQLPRTAAAPPASSAARRRLRPARTAPPYSTAQVAAGIAIIPAMVSAHR